VTLTENDLADSNRLERNHLRHRERIRNNLMLAGGVLILVALIIYGLRVAPIQRMQPPTIGQPISNIALKNLDGTTVSLKTFSGQLVLVNFWALWCPPCREEMPLLNAYYQQHRSDGFIILAVNSGDGPADIRAFAGQNNLTFPILQDSDSHVSDVFGIRNFPTSILVDRDGVVKDIQIGMFLPAELDAMVTPLLKKN
jgi:thiol-disulfide isomerase/thioredoxin